MRFLVGVVAVLASSCAGERVGLDDWGPVEIAAFCNEVSSFTTSNLTTRYYMYSYILQCTLCIKAVCSGSINDLYSRRQMEGYAV